MTLAEYRHDVETKIRRSSSVSEAVEHVHEAARTLRESTISSTNWRDFWISLYRELEPPINERQAASSLTSTMAAAQAAINSVLGNG